MGRSGSALVFLGVLMVAASFFLLAYEYYSIEGATSFAQFRNVTLYSAVSEALLAVGFLIAALGWMVGRAEENRALATRGGGSNSGGATVGYLLLGVGMLVVVGVFAYFAYLEFASYYSWTVSNWKWTYPTLESIAAVGLVMAGIGWLALRLDGLSRLGRALR